MFYKREHNKTVYPEAINGVWLVPADINLAAAELQRFGAISREYRLRNALAPVLDDYDFILIDCLPSLGLLSIISLTAATPELVPIQCVSKAFKPKLFWYRASMYVKTCIPGLKTLVLSRFDNLLRD
ncbi:hypothetical protein NIES2101_40915 [Calothrix sp. HK-06]|nr:hypothetical protein NIES2101_40915 [Calothrix sp. HK-06]